MGLIILFCSILVIAIGLTIVRATVGKYWTRDAKEGLEVLMTVCFVIAFILGLITCLIIIDSDEMATSLIKERESLMLYKEVIEASDNEYLRFEYFKKIQAFNGKLACYQTLDTDFFVGCFCDTIDVNQIDFQLKE